MPFDSLKNQNINFTMPKAYSENLTEIRLWEMNLIFVVMHFATSVATGIKNSLVFL